MSHTGTTGAGAGDRVDRALLASGLPLLPAPESSDPAWRCVAEFLLPEEWARLGRTYSTALGTPHLAPGLVCALQHYAGRALQPVVAAWSADGRLLDPRHELWWARVDDSAATTAVAVPGLPTVGRSADPEALAEVVDAHLGPLVDAVTEAGTATRRVALGCVAASASGAFAMAHRGSAPHARAAVRSAAEVVTARLASAPTRPSVTMVHLDDPDALVHDRHTCCLIRLGADGRVCASCPRLEPDARRRRQAEAARSATVTCRLADLQTLKRIA